MLLYKYLSPERIDVLSNLTIRFTQPSAFNDPFESRPHLVYDIDLERSLESLERTANECNMPEQHYQEMRQKYISGEIDHQWPDALNLMIDIMSSTTVCLSLTEMYDNLLMWAHYATNHDGFVIAFDSNHPFVKGPGKGIYKLTKVKYSTDRPNVGISKLTLVDTYFTKSTEWEYEQEWRVFASVDKADKIIEASPFPICLFSVPPDSIVQVILGCRMEKQKRDLIINLIEGQKSLKHITIKQANICDKHYRIEFNDVLLRG